MELTTIVIQFSTTLSAVGIIALFANKFLDKKLQPLSDKIDKKDYGECKRYLTDFLTDLENGIPKSEIQRQMASETYDHYIVQLKGNSWVEEKWNKLMK